VEPARVSIEAKSKSAEAPVPKAAAKMAKAASKMPAVTAAHRKSVASKAASNKAMNAPAKLPPPRANAAGVADVIVAVQTENAAASAIIILRLGSLLVSEPMRAPRMRSRNAAIIPGLQEISFICSCSHSISHHSRHFSRVRGS
jgi:hypothetical protein